jgi:large subunit ribosomal protein L25
MEIGTAVHAKDIALPSGTTLVTDPDALVLHVTAQQAADLGETEAEAEGEAAEPGEAAEAAEAE